MHRAWTGVTTAAAMLLFVSRSSAADARAEALYREAQRAAQVGDYGLACKKFDASQAAEPAPGTLLNVADCREREQKLVAAHEALASALALFSASDPRIAFAQERLANLDARLAQVTVHATRDARVEIDGKTARADTGVALEPGVHLIRVTAADHAEVTETVELAAGERREVDGKGAASLAAAPPPPTKNAGTPLRPLQIAMWSSFSVALVATTVGTFAGIRTIQLGHDADGNCNALGCNDAGLDAERQGRTFSAISTVSFVAAGAAIATGIICLVVDRNHRTVAAGSRFGFAF